MRNPDPVVLVAVSIRTLVEFVACAILFAEVALILRLCMGGN